MGCSSNARKEYRCCIAAENSAGKLKIAGKQYNACVLNTSATGYRVRVPNSVAKRVRGRRVCVLDFAGEQWEVEVKSRFTADNQFTDIGFTRTKELTRYTIPTSWSFCSCPNLNLYSDPAFLGFLVLAFLTAVVCLPGIGDSLGTAPRVKTAIRSFMGD
ncbi:MAG: hypothetical protein KDA72_19740 [Planctomycetales bacterium]|nr:hypothetical protein [Planctomycetales bacterium]